MTNMTTKAGERLIPPEQNGLMSDRPTQQLAAKVTRLGQTRTVAVNKYTSPLADGLVDELLCAEGKQVQEIIKLL